MARARARGLLLIGLCAVSSAPGAATLRDVADLPGAEDVAASAAQHPDDLRQLELELLARFRQGDDEGVLRRLRELDGAQPAHAATLRETMAGLYLRDRRLYRAGQHLEAIPPTRRSAQAAYFMANIAARQRRLDVALAGLDELARRRPGDPLVARDQAQIASLTGDHAKVVAACERLLASRPADEYARFQLARARMFQGRLGEAEAQLDALLDRNPRHGMAALNRGLLQLARGDFAGAREWFVRARSIESRDPTPYIAEAATVLLLGRRAEARAAVTGAVRQNGNDPLVGLVDLLARGHSSTPLVAATSRAVAASLYPDLERAELPASILAEIGAAPVAGRIAAASLLLQAWSPQAALDWLATQSKPGAAGPLVGMTAIRALVASGQLQAAASRAVQLAGSATAADLVGPAVQAAEIAARQGDRDGAAIAMQRALALAPDLPRLRMTSGDLYNALGQPARAMQEYRAALQGMPGEPRLLNQLAATIAAAGPRAQYEEALRLAEDGLRRRPPYLLRGRLLDTRADLLHRLGRRAEARAAYRELSTTVGGMTEPGTWHRLGELELAVGEIASARKAFEEALDVGRDYPQRARAIERLASLPASPPRK